MTPGAGPREICVPKTTAAKQTAPKWWYKDDRALTGDTDAGFWNDAKYNKELGFKCIESATKLS